MWINQELSKLDYFEMPYISKVISISNNKINATDGFINVSLINNISINVGDYAVLIPAIFNNDKTFICIGKISF